jgi:hypothetical protein
VWTRGKSGFGGDIAHRSLACELHASKVHAVIAICKPERCVHSRCTPGSSTCSREGANSGGL